MRRTRPCVSVGACLRQRERKYRIIRITAKSHPPQRHILRSRKKIYTDLITHSYHVRRRPHRVISVFFSAPTKIVRIRTRNLSNIPNGFLFCFLFVCSIHPRFSSTTRTLSFSPVVLFSTIVCFPCVRGQQHCIVFVYNFWAMEEKWRDGERGKWSFTRKLLVMGQDCLIDILLEFKSRARSVFVIYRTRNRPTLAYARRRFIRVSLVNDSIKMTKIQYGTIPNFIVLSQ